MEPVIEVSNLLRSLRYLFHRVFRLKTTTLDGIRLSCDRSMIERTVAGGIIRGGYEEAERKLAREAIRKGDWILEIGAGVGAVGIVCCKLAGNGQVTSYEANPYLEPVIRHNFALNGLEPNLVLKAVSVDGGPITFFRSDNIVSSSVFDRNLKGEEMTVDSVSMNQAISHSRAQVIVMDVEGAEVELLAAADLSGVREIIVEVHPHVVGAEAIERMAQNLCGEGFIRKGKRHKTEWFSRDREGVST